VARFTVYVDDNFHPRDESARYKYGDFDSAEEAVKACQKIVEEYFAKLEDGGERSFEELWLGYRTYGEDPFVRSEAESCEFSAWDYAEQRCRELAGEGPGSAEQG